MKKSYLAIVAILIMVGLAILAKIKPFRSTIPTPISSKQEKINLITKELRQEEIKVVRDPRLAPDNKTLLVIINKETKVLFSLDKDIQNQILSLQLILKRVRMENKQAKLIDLTLNSPHVVF